MNPPRCPVYIGCVYRDECTLKGRCCADGPPVDASASDRYVLAPKMKHGDAARMAELCEQAGTPLLTWQRHILDRLEAASVAQQFAEIVGRLR